MITFLKSVGERIPEPLARPLMWVPYRWRLGAEYPRAQEAIARYEAFDDAQRRAYMFQRVREVVEHALRHNAFYQSFYREQGFSLAELREFEDIARIPVVTKADLRRWSLNRRSTSMPGTFRVNTGGTSGQPLEFYCSRRVFAREWAHMHHVWGRVGFRRSDLKLTLRGKNTGARAVVYNPVHHELIASAYHPADIVANELTRLLRRREVRYLHGYPSTVYEFALYCSRHAPALLATLRRTLRGVLLGSEYPAPPYRQVIDEAFAAPSISWYGHSEMAVLAYERDEKYEYVPLQTYGYAEALEDREGRFRLLGTSYSNLASPFIRYDTGDEIEPRSEQGLLRAFHIGGGRVGEFVVDRSGKRVSLTALVFGRHHDAFGIAEFIQVHQAAPGRATILIVPASEGTGTETDWHRAFDLTGIDLDVHFEVRSRPVRSPAGKTPLLVSSADLERSRD